MQRENELDVPNVHDHTLDARHRTTNGSGRLHRVFDEPQVGKSDTVTLWERIKRSFPTTEVLEVAGRTIEKGLVLTPTMGLTIVLAVAGMMGTVYWRMSDQITAKDTSYQEQRDMLIEIKTELKIAKEHDSEFKHDQKEAAEIQNLKIQDLKDKLLVLNTKTR